MWAYENMDSNDARNVYNDARNEATAICGARTVARNSITGCPDCCRQSCPRVVTLSDLQAVIVQRGLPLYHAGPSSDNIKYIIVDISCQK